MNPAPSEPPFSIADLRLAGDIRSLRAFAVVVVMSSLMAYPRHSRNYSAYTWQILIAATTLIACIVGVLCALALLIRRPGTVWWYTRSAMAVVGGNIGLLAGGLYREVWDDETLDLVVRTLIGLSCLVLAPALAGHLADLWRRYTEW